MWEGLIILLGIALAALFYLAAYQQWPGLELLNHYEIPKTIAIAILSAVCVYVFFELHSSFALIRRLRKEIAETIINPATVVNSFSDRKRKDFILKCLPVFFNGDEPPADGLYQALEKGVDINSKYHRDVVWNITLYPHDEAFLRADITISGYKKITRNRFAVACIVDNPRTREQRLLAFDTDFVWAFPLQEQGDTLDMSGFSLISLEVGRQEMSFAQDETSSSESLADVDGIFFSSPPMELPRLHYEKEDGFCFFNFRFNVLIRRSIAALATSMRRPTKNFFAIVQYQNVPVDRLHHFYFATGSDLPDPRIRNDLDNKSYSVDVNGWIFVSGGIVFTWQERPWES